jgi:hypothetical protein
MVAASLFKLPPQLGIKWCIIMEGFRHLVAPEC